MSHNDDPPVYSEHLGGYTNDTNFEYGSYEPDDDQTPAEQHNQNHLVDYTHQHHHHDHHYHNSGETVLDRVFAAHPELDKLPPHACTYCGVHDIDSVAQCTQCDRWFCNEMGETKASHLITHLVRAHHRSFKVHPKSSNHDVDLECLFCNTKNIFLLGTMNAKEDNVVALVCRTPCALLPKVKKMFRMTWTPLIKNKSIVRWLLPPPSQDSLFSPIPITPWLITQLEEAWRTNPQATLNDLYITSKTPPLAPVPQRFEDALHYRDVMLHLVELEANTDRVLKTAQSQNGISVQWSESVDNDAELDNYSSSSSYLDDHDIHDHSGSRRNNSRQLFASFTFFQNEETSLKVVHGDELILTYGDPNEIGQGYWEGEGYVVNVTLSGRVVINIKHEFVSTAPTSAQHGYTVQPKWNSTSYTRMQVALDKFSMLSDPTIPFQKRAMSQNLYLQLLGHSHSDEGIDIIPPEFHQLPRLPPLNQYQSSAIRDSLTQTLSLLQGPPGTGKTTTCAYLVYNLHKALTQQRSSRPRPILVCAPSNVAADHLTEKIHLTGLKVVRVVARSRQAISSTVDFLSLHVLINQMAERSTGRFSTLYQLERNNPLKLSQKMRTEYLKLLYKVQIAILNNADVICTTCTTIGNDRLFNTFEFHHVLIDEATQCCEPEILIPLTRKAKQVILVGDHCQLGPVVMSKQAAGAGFNRSIFERLLLLGHVPKVLQIQYRMHPALASFPANTFYDGTLLNGIKEQDRSISRQIFPWPNPAVPMAFIAATGVEEFSASGSSFLNRHETGVVEQVLLTLVDNGVQPGQIGIITPYEGQRLHLVTTLAREDSPVINVLKRNSKTNLSSQDALVALNTLEIASVDSFQGREKDFIIFTCVRSNDHGDVGFLSDPRRQNVALTRARYGLIMTGNPRVLGRQPLWHALLCHFKQHNALVEGSLSNLRPCTVVLPPPSTFISARSVRIPIGFDPKTSFGMQNARNYSLQVAGPSGVSDGGRDFPTLSSPPSGKAQNNDNTHNDKNGSNNNNNNGKGNRKSGPRHRHILAVSETAHESNQTNNLHGGGTDPYTMDSHHNELYYSTDVQHVPIPTPVHPRGALSPSGVFPVGGHGHPSQDFNVFHFDPRLFDVSAHHPDAATTYAPMLSLMQDAFVVPPPPPPPPAMPSGNAEVDASVVSQQQQGRK